MRNTTYRSDEVRKAWTRLSDAVVDLKQCEQFHPELVRDAMRVVRKRRQELATAWETQRENTHED